MWTFYLRNDFKALDTMLALLLYVGVVDGYVCWQEGAQGRAVFRLGCGFVISIWGFAGLTSRTARI
jgi:hypothetical protein